MTQELYKRYRPRKLDEIVGQERIVSVLKGLLVKKQFPHTLLLSGPSGCGKTTIARILRRELGCSKQDFSEMNAADQRGIDSIREIRSRMHSAPIGGECRIWLIDECHATTSDAQDAMLKMLEDTPSHVYFMLATTNPTKLMKTILTRCTPIKVKPLDTDCMRKLLDGVLSKEKKGVEANVLQRIIEVAEGSPRQALVILGSIFTLESVEDQLEAIYSSDHKGQAFDIVKALLYERTTWKEMTETLAKTDTSQVESLRHFILACARTELLKANKNAGRAFGIIRMFQDAWYEYPEVGLEASCYEILANR